MELGSMDTGEMHRRTVDWWTSRLAAVGDDQWSGLTPCSDWDVRELVNHVTGEDLWTVPLLEGRTIEEVGDRYDGDLLGDSPVAAGQSAAGAAVTAVADLLPQCETVHLSYGDERADEYVWQLCADHLVHGWDLAAAVGSDATMPEDLVAALTEWFSPREEGYRSAGVIGDQRPLPGDAQGDLLARFGRDAAWSPSGS
jgi:uncharacterized protein (TIGR03086 family)